MTPSLGAFLPFEVSSISRDFIKWKSYLFYEIGTTDDNEYPDDGFYSPVGCGRTFNSSTGDIISPNFPKHYGNNMNCNYFIDVEPQSLVILTFVSFHLEGIFILFKK